MSDAKVEFRWIVPKDIRREVCQLLRQGWPLIHAIVIARTWQIAALMYEKERE
ncbi:hypothetical protein JF540_21665 [Salipiger thiooxidans]|uniref:hypothetical protein n=1 Tax=Salipiger thiooxidans TaxID=282683 RepID=UPI001A8ED2BA|nr:hypothetical protein [Salipiger thiooxidans]MBN8189296.1 hypothetical protein [Salipiger thiooxidans]